MKTNSDKTQISNEVAAGVAFYSKPVLSIYDFYVLKFSNTFVWKCPSQLILDFYNEHVSERHMDIGVGTGYFLDKCKFPSTHPTIALVDLNPTSLEVTAKRLCRYQLTTHVANVLEPLPLDEPSFGSIGLNYLMHCLPGQMLSKGIIFSNLLPHLKLGGKVFGTTLLGQGIQQNFLAKAHINFYNSKGIFCNSNDNAASLESILKDNFRDYSIRIVGCVAFFVGQT